MKKGTLITVAAIAIVALIAGIALTKKETPAVEEEPAPQTATTTPVAAVPEPALAPRKSESIARPQIAASNTASATTTLAQAVPRDAFSERMFEITNSDRAANQLPPLKYNAKLEQAAYEKLADMAQNHYFAHVSPAGLYPWDWFKAVGYDYVYAGENLGRELHSPQDGEAAFMASPLHRQNILSPDYKEVGVAAGQAMCDSTCASASDVGREVTYVVVMFGSR